MSNLTLKEVKIALNSVETEQDLIQILKTVDITSQNTLDDAKTLLYSGVGQLSEDVVSDNTIRLLDKTPAAELIKSFEFDDAIEIVFGSSESPEANNFLYKTNGGAWDTISERFVNATAYHEVDTLIGDRASPDRTFFQTELQAIKTNDNITHIDGIEKQTLFKELETLGDPQHQINYSHHPSNLQLIHLCYNNHNKTA